MEGSEGRSEVFKEVDGDDTSFMRTEDVVCLVCTSGDTMKHGYLAAEGFGSQLCHLEPEPRNQEPCELWKCTFQLEDALSVHAMYTQGINGTSTKKQSNRRILMYGHAILLRHISTKKLLRCLSTSPTNDKLAYNIGFTQHTGKADESCWFTVHPASSQRSEGEKVRAGDDIYLVNVANERYLSAQLSFFQNAESDSLSTSKQPLNTVYASFHQCVWALHIVCSGSAKEVAIGNVNGGDIVRFIHRHRGEDALTVAARECDRNASVDKTTTDVRYEVGDSGQLRSLWRVELFQMRFGGGFTSWGQPFRLRHVVTGKFLGVKGEGGGEGKRGKPERHSVGLLDPSEASMDATAFCFTDSSCSHQKWLGTKVDGMGSPEVHFGDSSVYLRHIKTQKYVGCPVSERRHHVLPGIQRAIMLAECPQSIAFTVTRALEEHAKAACIAQLAESTMRNYVHKMLIGRQQQASHLVEDLLHVLSDLCHYFARPSGSSLSHDALQQQLCELRERQGVFRRHGTLLFTLTVIRQIGKATPPGPASHEQIHHKLYELLAAMIWGNHDNCREFATKEWLDVFTNQLNIPTFTHDVLEVIQCLLTDSPEVLNILSERHISVIVNLLNTTGRDEKVMKLISSFCVCHGVAMRDKQRLIYKHLLSCRDLLLQTSLHDQVYCVHPNVHVGVQSGSALYHKWYFEVELTHLAAAHLSKVPTHFRAGWAHSAYFLPRPSSNSVVTTSGGVGDDVYSVGYDGLNFWVGGHQTNVRSGRFRKKLLRQESLSFSPTPSVDAPLSVGDVIGCCLDLERGVAWFMKNGKTVSGHLEFHHCKDMITPAISFSSGVSAVVSLGGRLGKFRFSPPAGYSGLQDALSHDGAVELKPFICQTASTDLMVSGPVAMGDYETFTPAPIDTSKVSLPDPVMKIRQKLAENIHEVWAVNKIEAGFTYAEERNDTLKHNPSLRAFEELSEAERRYDYDMALETLSTLVALGYQIGSNEEGGSSLAYVTLPDDPYRMSNGYKPRPLNLEGIELEVGMVGIVDKLAENAHNIWAASRINQGWKYGLSKDAECKRNPLLKPYHTLDATGKKSNWDTAFETVRTICALGCRVEPPVLASLGPSMHQLAREYSEAHVRTRTYRGQTCYMLTSGKWYYEAKLWTGGMMRVGWALPSFPAGKILGSDEHSYSYDGFLARKWHDGSEKFGRRWSEGDVVGCLLNLDEGTMSFTLNGELLTGTNDSSVAFDRVVGAVGLVPAITLSTGEHAQFNFGRSDAPLNWNFTSSGFDPVCSPSALHYNIPLWYSSNHGHYDVIDHTHRRLSASSDRFSSISVQSREWDYSKQATQECLKLNLGVALVSLATSPSLLQPRPGPLTSPSSPLSESALHKGFMAQQAKLVAGKRRVSYSVNVPPGQDPKMVFVGWTTAGFRYIPSQFHASVPKQRRISCVVSPDSCLLEAPDYSAMTHGQQIKIVTERGQSHEMTFSTAFMVCLSDLLVEVDSHLPTAARVSCVLDITTGAMEFLCSIPGGGRQQRVTLMANTRSCKLFPTAIVTPTVQDLVEFDFRPEPDCHSLSSVIIPSLSSSSSSSSPPSPCPPRMKLMSHSPSKWVRSPDARVSFTSSTSSTGAMQVVADREPNYTLYVTLPEEDTVMSILELSEHHDLIDFHIQALEAYCSVSSHSNLEISEAISSHFDSDQLLQCLRTAGMRYELRAAYLRLLSYLHLEHEVRTRLMMRGEFILPLSDCTRSVPLFPLSATEASQRKPTVYRIAMAPLFGLDSALCSQANISHDITSTFSKMASCSASDFPIHELKELVFTDLEVLLSSKKYKLRLNPSRSRSEIFVPLIEVLDNLLVMGVIQADSDLKRLLLLLDPEQFLPKTTKKPFKHGLLCESVATEEPMKLALCQLLQHLCDCQVQHRVEAIVTFGNSFVADLQHDQSQRHQQNFQKKPREFRSPPSKQIESMLSFRSRVSSDCFTNKPLQAALKAFHAELMGHCGCQDQTGAANKKLDDLSFREKLQRLKELLVRSEETGVKHADKEVTTLQQLISRTMIRWAGQDVRSLELIKQVFSLLYRQFDEVQEVAHALRKTYVLEVVKDSSGKANYDIPRFRTALGSLRLLLSVGMGKTEENLLKKSLKAILHSDLFYCHPNLLRSLGVHSTVLGLMRTYLGISAGGGANDRLLAIRRRQRLAHSFGHQQGGGGAPPIKECCKFLCKFARISQDNQRALFDHIGYLLEHAEKFPDLMACDSYTPLDVATATIKENQELTLALNKSHLENVVSLLVGMTTNVQSQANEALDDHLQTIHVSKSFSYEWSPTGGEKCLEFLRSAVWVEGEQIQENAYIIVRLLIRHSECLGPALAGDALGLQRVYKEALEYLEEEEEEDGEGEGGKNSLAASGGGGGGMQQRPSTPGLSQSSSNASLYSRLSSQISLSNLYEVNAKGVLDFYTSLIRLLACCAPSPSPGGGGVGEGVGGPPKSLNAVHSNTATRQKQSTVERTKNILQNLINEDEIVGILSLPFARSGQKGVHPVHKEAALLFLERVYGIPTSDLLLKLLVEAFLPDIKTVLKLNEREGVLGHLKRYLCCSVLPLLTSHASVFKQLWSHLHVVDNLLVCCFRLSSTAQLSSLQRDHVAAFLIALTKELGAKVIMRFMPRIIADIPNLQAHTTVACKLLAAHYEHYARYYEGGMLDGTVNLAAEEKLCSALTVYRLLDSLAKKMPSESSDSQRALIRSSVACLKAITRALPPDCLVPCQQVLSTLYHSSSSSYDPSPVDTSHVTLCPELVQFAAAFASYVHDCWIYEKQSEGWVYGAEEDAAALRHPNLRPFSSLPPQVQEQTDYLSQAEAMVKYLLARGWSISKHRQADRNVPCKPRKTCVWTPKRRVKSKSTGVRPPTAIREEEVAFLSYEPEVMDLEKVEVSIKLLALTERMAENAHDMWAQELKRNNADYRSHPDFLAYELLEGDAKDRHRKYSLDLLRFFKVSGYEPQKTRVAITSSSSSSSNQASQSQEKFSLQLFDKLLQLLSSPGLDAGFFVKVLCPTLTGYLQQHAGYFLPSGILRGHSFASREEKIKIMQMFCRVSEFTGRSLSRLFPTVTRATPGFLSPSGVAVEGGKTSDSDANWSTARTLLALLKSFISAMDIKAIAEKSGRVSKDCPEMVDFFRKAGSAIVLTAENIGKQDQLDARFHFYCLHLLIPALSALFRHVGQQGAGETIIEGAVQSHCRHIFLNLVEIATGTAPVYVGSSPLIAIGQCMGSFALAFPKPFLDNSQFGFSLPQLVEQLEVATSEGVTCGNVLYVVDIIIPVLASYITRWWNCFDPLDSSAVTVTQVDRVLSLVLSLLGAHFTQRQVAWFHRVIDTAVPLAARCSLAVLHSHLLPIMEELRERAIGLWQDEQYLSADWAVGQGSSDQQAERQEQLVEDYRIFARDLASVTPFVVAFLNAKGEALWSSSTPLSAAESKCPLNGKGGGEGDGGGGEEYMESEYNIKGLFVSVADVFHCWSSSQHFRRELQGQMQLMAKKTRLTMQGPVKHAIFRGGPSSQKRPFNILVHCLELVLPLGNQLLHPEDRKLVASAQEKLAEKGVTPDDVKLEILKTLEAREGAREQLSRKLVRQLSMRYIQQEASLHERALNILSLARVKHKLEQAARHDTSLTRWRQLFSYRKRKAILNCFLAVPYFELSRHRAINLFLTAYCCGWLTTAECTNHRLLSEELLDRPDFVPSSSSSVARQPQGSGAGPDPLAQLFTMFKRVASTQECIDVQLYTAYADVLSTSVIGRMEDEEMSADDNPTKAYELYSKKKAELLLKQGQLADRGAPVMVLEVITASHGCMSPVVHSTLRLGIALLKEGNLRIQTEMLHYLKGMDVGFFSSVARLIGGCSVLNWSAYERYNKTESSQDAAESACGQALPHATFTSSLFRFLQLLCEGHNADFQNYLRTQAGNTTTVNVIICSVDYLLRLQESISDFYWHYSDYSAIDIHGRENFHTAFKVSKQVFRTLTEYIQGPCVANQEALARSRLWDAVSGFLHIFAVLQRKLYTDTSQVELLRELLSLQEEMFILLLAMLEGSAMASKIGRMTVDMLVESAQSITDILQFFSIFVKLKDVTTSKAFKEYDLNKDGLISYREFERAMENQQRYNKEEIAYLMECADINKDGLLDYMEFTERFHQPAESIGFHLCVLIVHLTDHMPQDKRLECFRQCPQGRELMEHFQRNMGCIEILGKSRRIERVYFEVKESRLRQSEETQIQESKRSFLHSVELGSQKSKLNGFISFCEDTIFEMDYADTIIGAEANEREDRALRHRKQHNRQQKLPSQPFLSRVKASVSAMHRRDYSSVQRLVSWLAAVWLLLTLRAAPAVRSGLHSIREKASGAYGRLWSRLSPSPAAATNGSTADPVRRKRPQLSLKISKPGFDQYQPKTAVHGHKQQQQQPPFDPSSSSSSSTVDPSLRHRTIAPPQGLRMRSLSHKGVSELPQGGPLVYTPHQHSRQLTLNYDRSRMKKPSPFAADAASSPVQEAAQTGGGSLDSYMPQIVATTRSWPSLLARNYYRLTNFKFVLTFFINVLLLTFKVSEFPSNHPFHLDNGTVAVVSEGFWAALGLSLLALLHFIFSVILIVSYWYLKVPLIIFKREKHVARQLELKQKWLKTASAEAPEGVADWWDGLVISSRSFPCNYWDKQVKQRVTDRFPPEQQASIAKQLGMGSKSKFDKKDKWGLLVETVHSLVDIRYAVWSLGVVMSNIPILYHCCYCALSFLGLRWNSFYFSVHLLDLIGNFKLLRTVLRSVMHNAKQLGMTVLMTCVVIYIYTVIAFNFFRKFYRQSDSAGQEVHQCESMFRCFIYHFDKGLRSGGGIADVLKPADGDPHEFLRLFFDITFFFVVIIILLAIMQGLIIDAFGELRDKEETLTTEMQTKCFVCGLPKSEFDHIPHGFDNHISREHSMAHYMFFLLYLIKKRESEFSGQESYVWELYLKQNWDFVPVGDCFQAQEERKAELASGLGHHHHLRKQKPPPFRKAKTVT